MARREAFVSLATNDYYAQGALALGHSIRQTCTTRRLALLITNSVTPDTKQHLSQVWDELITVDELDSSDARRLALLTRPELGVTFSKLHAWRLTQYSKCVFLDADTLVLQNVDELFDREELSAAPDIGWPDCFNSGVFVFEPSDQTFNRLVTLASQIGSFDGGDQGLLNTFWSDWATKDAKYRLPFIYNVVPNITYGYRPAYLKFHSNIKIVHFIGPVKPWQPHLAESEDNFIKMWWKVWTSLEQSLPGRIRREVAPPLPKSTSSQPSHHTSQATAETGGLAHQEESVRAAAAEQRAMIAEMRAQLAEAKANERIQEAERRARSAEDSRAWAEQRAQNVAQQLREAERRVQEGLQREEQVLAQVNLVENQRRTAEQRRQEAEQRCQNVAQQLREAERRVQEGLQREEQVLAQVNLVENRRRIAEQKRQEAEQRCQNVAQQLREAERRVQEGLQREELAQVNLVENQRRTDTSEQRHQEAEQRCQEAELELREVKNHWTVQREDIEISDRELGRGGWGVVKIATFCGICVAAKCFYRELSSSYYRYLFEREMNMAARLRHPNLVQFIGATLEGEPIILMELMSKSLRALLESGPISLHQTTSICIDVGLVLNYLHKMKPQPVIHRDLSSANILLNPLPGSQWRAKISDYGSVNVLQQLRTVGPGSPVYAAPEAKDPHLQSPKMDIFSFGVLMIEMLTDQFPEVRIRRRLIGSIRHAGYVALIQRCMDEDREWRPSAEEVLSQLKDFEH